MNLLISQLKAGIQRLLESKGIRARVLDKVNRYGEVVIGIILEKPETEVRTADREGLRTGAVDLPKPRDP